MTLLRHAASRARLTVFWMLGSAVLALVAAVLAAWSGNAIFDAWFWMPVIWGVVMLVGLFLGIARNGLPAADGPAPGTTGSVTRDLTAAVNQWRDGKGLTAWQRTTGAMATISMAIAGAAIALLTGEVFLGMPLSWWVIGMAILVGIGVLELTRVLRTHTE